MRRKWKVGYTIFPEQNTLQSPSSRIVTFGDMSVISRITLTTRVRLLLRGLI